MSATYLGDFAEDAVVHFKWSTQSGAGGAITRATNGTVCVYKADGTTESTAGITDTEDFDSVTGVHHGKIDLSADAFYATANDYQVVLTSATIDGQTVSTVLFHFSIENRFAEVDVTKFGGTAGTFASGRPEVNTTHAAGTAWASGAITRDTFAPETGLQTVRSGTAQAGAGGSITLDAGASSSNDFYKGRWIVPTGGTGVGQPRFCTTYNGTTKVATVLPVWQTTPDNTTTFAILNSAAVDVYQWVGSNVSATTAGTPNVNVTRINNASQATPGGANGILISGANTGTTQLGGFTVTGATTFTGAVTATNASNNISGVDVTSISGDSTAADNAEAFFDGTGYAGTGNVIPTVTTATNVTTVNGLAAGVITAASIDADAITDAKVASDVTIASVTGAVGSVTGAVGSVTGNVGGNVVGSVGSVTAGVTVTTNNDKTGYGLSSTAVQAIWDALTSALTTANSIGKKLADWTIGTAQTGDAYARLGAPAGASVSADIAAVKADTAALPSAAATATAVRSELTTELGRIDAATTSRMASYTQPTGFLAATFPTTVASTTNITGGTITTVTNLTNAPTSGDLTATMKASVVTAAATALTDIHLDHLLAVDYDPAAKPGTATALLNELIGNDAGVSQFTANALELGPSGSGGDGSAFTAIPWNAAWDAEVQSEVEDALIAYGASTVTDASVADAVWDEPTAGHVTSDTYGVAVVDTIAVANDTLATLDILVTTVGGIVTDTSNTAGVTNILAGMYEDSAGYRWTTKALEQSPTGGSAPTAAAIADAVWDEATSGHTTSGTFGEQVKTDIDAILLAVDTNGVVLSAAQMNKIADHVRRRTQANVEASSDGDALSLGSLYGFIQQAQESAVSGSTLTVYRTDGSTSLGTKTVASSSGADPITGVS